MRKVAGLSVMGVGMMLAVAGLVMVDNGWWRLGRRLIAIGCLVLAADLAIALVWS
jgi:hypothetical protein